MMTYEKASDLLRDFADVQNRICKAVNTKRGMTKKLEAEEVQVVSNILTAMTGEIPSADQVKSLIEFFS